MIEVRIRHENMTAAVHLTEVEHDGLDPLLSLIRGWGISVDGGDFDNLSGRFVLDDTAAFFEIIVSEDEA